jgi:hypothetical protein
MKTRAIWAVTLIPGYCLAHPGHGVNGVGHYLLASPHSLVFIIGGLLIGAMIRSRIKQKEYKHARSIIDE